MLEVWSRHAAAPTGQVQFRRRFLLLGSSLVLLAACASSVKAPQPALLVSSAPAASAAQKQPLPPIASAEEGFSFALEALRGGDPEIAGLYARSVRERFPTTLWSSRSLFLLGRSLIARDMTDEARSAILLIPADYPDLADYALLALADHLGGKGRWGEATDLYLRVAGEYRTSVLVPRALLQASQAMISAGRHREAAAVLEQILKDFPRSEQAPEAGIAIGRIRFDAGDLSAAARAYLDVQVKYPGTERDQEIAKALAAVRSAGGDVPRLTASELYERGRSLYRLGQYEMAQESYLRAIEADPTHPQKADILLRSGIALYNLGRRPEAASVLEKLLKARLPDCRCGEALYWLGKSYSRLGMRDEAVETFGRLVRTYPESDWADDALYLAGNVYRDAGDMKQALKYYRRLVEEYPDSNLADSAIWWDGWSSYSAGDLRKAELKFREILQRYPRSFLANQALYWLGRTAEARGDNERAMAHYRRLLARGPFTYYGFRTTERMASAGVQPFPAAAELMPASAAEESDESGPPSGWSEDGDEPDGPPDWTEEALATLDRDPSFRRTRELMVLGMKREAVAELGSVRDRDPVRRATLLGLSKVYFELGDYHTSLSLVLKNFERTLERPSSRYPEDLWLLAYPQGYWSSITSSARRYGIDPYFVAAIIREESQFKPEALSPAGARGVMQVMPSTGEWIAKNAGFSGYDRTRLYDADTNIALGAWYLQHLAKRFHGDLTLVSAAYNAGPEAAAAWAARNGPVKDAARFVETIPFAETRGYVKKVLRNYAEYRRIYGRTFLPPDLTTGGTDQTGEGRQFCRAMNGCPDRRGGESR